MIKWEYKILLGRAWTRDKDVVCVELQLQGKSGWELVAVEGDHFIFKRELASAIIFIPDTGGSEIS